VPPQRGRADPHDSRGQRMSADTHCPWQRCPCIACPGHCDATRPGLLTVAQVREIMAADRPSLILSASELKALSGGATLPHVQVRRLRAAGYVRARLVNGFAIVERAHVEAVAEGRFGTPEAAPAPQLNMAALAAHLAARRNRKSKPRNER